MDNDDLRRQYEAEELSESFIRKREAIAAALSDGTGFIPITETERKAFYESQKGKIVPLANIGKD